MMNREIQEFWETFKCNAAELATTHSAETRVYDRILSALQAVHSGLFFEFSSSSLPHEFIVTAEGDRTLFDLARLVVGNAPSDTGWKLLALKPKLGFPAQTAWEGAVIDLSSVVIDPLESPSGDLGIRLLVPGLESSDYEKAHNALLRAIDHGLGEEQFANEIRYTEVMALPADLDPKTCIPLTQLESYINWRRSHA